MQTGLFVEENGILFYITLSCFDMQTGLFVEDKSSDNDETYQGFKNCNKNKYSDKFG